MVIVHEDLNCTNWEFISNFNSLSYFSLFIKSIVVSYM